jgi:ABC-type Na+ efflux pump permease subunit
MEQKKSRIIANLLLAVSIIILLIVLIPKFMPVTVLPAMPQSAVPSQAQPAPTLPAYIQSSVARDIAKGFAYFIIITGLIVAIIAFLISKKIIRIKKEKAIFWDY